ncbi:MAG: glycosyltransferase [Muribaculaceae bacterium]|nr:glycosyltransferase [Muribaculaceae bacterium]
MNEKLFSIVTVTWNAATVIGPTLQSVREQTCMDYEYLVIDGASSDNTLQLVRDADIAGTRIYSEPDRGLYDAMNKAIARAEGQYLIWLNAGDRFASPASLARLAACAEGHPGVIYGQTQLVDGTGQVVGMRHLTAPKVLTADSFKQGMLVCHQAFVARRDLMPQYDLQYRFSADYDWCIRVLKASERNAYCGDEPIINFLTDGLTDKYHKQSLMERYRIMCHHYGTLPTIVRHLGFIPRYLRRKF